MRRRRVIALAVLALPGCSGQREAEPTATLTATPSPEPTPAPASLSVEEFTVTSIVEIGTTFSMRVTVTNAGDLAGSFESSLSVKYGSSSWQQLDRAISFEVPGGETVSKRYEMPPASYERPVSYRLDAVEKVARSTFVGRELSWGGSHTLPSGIELTVTRPQFGSTYTYQSEEGEKTIEPSSGEKWAVYTVRAKNTGDEPAEAPLMSDVILHHGESEFRGAYLSDNRDQYRGGTIEPGQTHEGDIPCDVPTALTVGDLHVNYHTEYEAGEVNVTWKTPDE